MLSHQVIWRMLQVMCQALGDHLEYFIAIFAGFAGDGIREMAGRVCQKASPLCGVIGPNPRGERDLKGSIDNPSSNHFDGVVILFGIWRVRQCSHNV